MEDLIPTLSHPNSIFKYVLQQKVCRLSKIRQSNAVRRKQPGAHRQARTHAQKQSLLSDPLYFPFPSHTELLTHFL